MANFTLRQIVEITGGRLLGKTDIRIKGISTDSRTLSPGNCFVALRGENDGNRFIPKAISKGAVAIITEKSHELSVPTIEVENSWHALSNLARFHRDRVSPVFVGITGSLGKTTTKDLTYQILSKTYHAHKSRKSFNNHLGVPLTLLELKQEHEVAILELGASAPGEISTLSQLLRPDIGVITCVAQSHLQGFGDACGIEKAKGELLEGMEKHSTLIVNKDDAACMRIAQKFSGKVKTFGCGLGADYRGTHLYADNGRLEFRINEHKFKAPFPGRHNIYNILASVAVGRTLDIPWDKLRDHLAVAVLPPMRMEIKRLRDIILLKDCYNSNPQALSAAIQGLADFPAKRKIAILSGMLELGRHSVDIHYETGKRLAGTLDVLICLGEEAKDLARGAAKGMPEKNILHFDSLERLIAEVSKILGSGDVVLVKGSRKFRLERLCDIIETKLPK